MLSWKMLKRGQLSSCGSDLNVFDTEDTFFLGSHSASKQSGLCHGRTFKYSYYLFCLPFITSLPL